LDRDKDVGWYDKGEPNISQATRTLLEKYSKIPPDQVIPHLMKTVCRLDMYVLVGDLMLTDVVA